MRQTLSRCLLLLVLFGGTAAAQANLYAEGMQRGGKLYAEGKYGKARKAYLTASKAAPADWRPRFFNVVCLLQLAVLEDQGQRRTGFLEQARRQTDLLVSETDVKDYTDPLPLYLYGLGLFYLDRYKEAIDKLESSLNSQPDRLARYAVIDLRSHLYRALGRTYHSRALTWLNAGKYEDASTFLTQAERYLPKDSHAFVDLQRNMAFVDTTLTRYDSAVKRFRKCIELNPKGRARYLGMIANIHVALSELDEAEKVLAEVPPDATDREVVAVRCFLATARATQAGPGTERMTYALDLYKRVIPGYPKKDRYRLIKEYGYLVVNEAIDAGDVTEADRKLLLGLEKMLKVEVEERPECAFLYFTLARAYALLGRGEEQHRYEQLGARKKAEFNTLNPKERFDAEGRARCGN
ncbi:MAG: tetratricopeptide repeat protein [Planctomycetota bacterium]|nr:tetratricopeptide repeat protein [Planctomycetota bacterium]